MQQVLDQARASALAAIQAYGQEIIAKEQEIAARDAETAALRADVAQHKAQQAALAQATPVAPEGVPLPVGPSSAPTSGISDLVGRTFPPGGVNPVPDAPRVPAVIAPAA